MYKKHYYTTLAIYFYLQFNGNRRMGGTNRKILITSLTFVAYDRPVPGK